MKTYNYSKLFFLLWFLLLVMHTGCSPLVFNPAYTKNVDTTRQLIEKGADVNAKDFFNGATPLHSATYYGNIEVVRLLLDKGADVNATAYSGLTPLHNAAIKGYVDIVTLLIERDANVNIKDNSGGTPLLYAVGNGQPAIVRLLLEKGTDVNVKEAKHGITPLHNATIIGHAEIVRMLLDHGANIDTKSENGLTALHEAAVSGHTEIARILLERGADYGTAATFKDGTRATPLQVAVVNGHTSIVRLIKEAEAMEAQKPLTRADISKTIFTSTSDENIISQIDSIPTYNTAPREYDMAVIIGIENYQGLQHSDFSKSDATTVKNYFKALGFQERNIELITDEKATRSGIEKAVEAWLPNRAKKDSKVYIYYSGHGAPEPTTGEAYIVPYDGDPNYLSITGYPLKRLYDKLGKLQVQEVVVFLDSCFSGSGGRSVLAKGARPLVMLPGITVLPANMVVLTATQGSQISTSSPEKEHGVFTYYFLQALKDGKKELSEIYDYIKPLIEDEAKSLNVSQSPSITPESAKIKGKFNLRP